MVASVQRQLQLLLKAWGGSEGCRWRSEGWLVAVIVSGHHHDLLPLLLRLLLGGGGGRGPDAAGWAWGHQLHLRHCVPS